MNGSSKSVIVVGGGVVGLCSAYYALLAGHRVIVLERGAPDHNGCSLGNAGMVVPSHVVPLAAPGMISYGLRMLLSRQSPFGITPRADLDLIRWGLEFMQSANADHVARAAPLLRDLHLASRSAFEQLADEIGEFGLVKRGLLMLCKAPDTFREESRLADEARKLGLAAGILSPEEAAKLDPDVRMDIAGAVHFADDCHLDPSRLMTALAQAMQHMGGEIRWGTQVTGWRAANGRIEAVRTDSEDLPADEFVISGGAWSSQIVKELGIRLPMQAGKGYSMTLPNPPRRPHLCSILVEARVAVTPMGESLRFAGTMEVGGLDLSINPARVNGIRKSVPRYLPEFAPEDFRDVPVWSGLRPCSPDGLPYIGRFRQFSNLAAATGHAMMGVSLAPVTGKLICALLSDEQPAIDIGPLSPDRYMR